MSEPRLTIRSGKARDLARRLADREKQPTTKIIERALELYATRATAREPAASFYARLRETCGTDIDLEAVIREARRLHPGADH